MVCFHRRYTLGDEHHYDDAEEFFQKLVQESIPDQMLFPNIKNGNVDGLKLEYNKSAHEWELNSYSDFSRSGLPNIPSPHR